MYRPCSRPHHVCRYGADIDAEDLAGNSPAHMAAAQGHLALLSALLQVLRTCTPDQMHTRCQMVAVSMLPLAKSQHGHQQVHIAHTPWACMQ